MGKQRSTMSMTQEELFGRVASLEQRVASLEAQLTGTQRLKAARTTETNADEEADLGFNGAALESSFGEFGLAWIGNLVLLFGIIFLVKYLENKGLTILSPVIGYAASASLIILSRYLRNSNQNLSSIFNLTGFILLFIVTVLLHFFTKAPLISSRYLALILLIIVSAVQGYVAIRNSRQGLTGVAFLMVAVTAVLSDQTHILLPLMVVISLAAVVLMQRFGWWRLLIFSIFLVYFVNLIWLLGNPFMGHKLQVLKDPDAGYVYLYLIAAVYSYVALIRQKGLFPDYGAISSIIINGLGFSLMVSLIVLAFFKDNYILLFGSIALSCLVYSIFLQTRSEWKVTASLYALYSFVALSVTVYGIFGFPKAYFLLAIQSLLVVSMALWFKSRVIVIMNTFLFLILLFTYLSNAHSVNAANISFALVSLITARTLNWQKERLHIKTELLRNTYLLTGFGMVLYALFRIVPAHYVTLSWTIAAGLYFALSFAMHNIKYRYLALGTMAAAALHLFIVDLARVEIVYRVLAFLFLAMISISLSLYYTRRRKRKLGSEQF